MIMHVKWGERRDFSTELDDQYDDYYRIDSRRFHDADEEVSECQLIMI